MSETVSQSRGTWNSKIGFIMAAAGSAVGLGNIWGFPTQVADNGGAAFILIYLFCCLVVGFPLMVAELAIGRNTEKNPIGAFRQLGKESKLAPIIGIWGVICGVMILSFYLVISGWTLGYVFEEILYFFQFDAAASSMGDLGNGPKNAFFSILFMIFTVGIITGGVSHGIERATKTLMPLLFVLLLILIGYIFTQDGATDGLLMYVKPDFSTINSGLVFSAMGQAFFSLSLGMGTLITYGSYLNKRQNLVESAAYVTLTDIMIAIVAGLLVVPAMFVAQYGGTEIFDPATGALYSSVTLVFDVLPELFHQIGGAAGMVIGIAFFILLGLAALTSSISLLEVPVAFVIDELHIPRKKAAWIVGLLVCCISIVISFDTSLIDLFVIIFNEVGLPLGGLMICLFLGYVWKSESAIDEIEQGFPNVRNHWFAPVWSFFMKYVCPVLITLILITILLNIFS